MISKIAKIRVKTLVFGFTSLVVIAALGVLMFLRLNNSQNQSSKETISNTGSTLNSKVECARFTNLETALAHVKQACALDLSYKNLSTFPSGISKLSKLTQIDLSNNKFTHFPEELLSLQNLIGINLSGNKISSLPTTISKLKKLQLLDMSNNKLEALPPEISSMKELTYLILKGNPINKSELDKIKALPSPELPQASRSSSIKVPPPPPKPTDTIRK